MNANTPKTRSANGVLNADPKIREIAGTAFFKKKLRTQLERRSFSKKGTPRERRSQNLEKFNTLTRWKKVGNPFSKETSL